ncbi:hypothetical protein CsSME_00031424 [Camellia sinensis var. sinensis]
MSLVETRTSSHYYREPITVSNSSFFSLQLQKKHEIVNTYQDDKTKKKTKW